MTGIVFFYSLVVGSMIGLVLWTGCIPYLFTKILVVLFLVSPQPPHQCLPTYRDTCHHEPTRDPWHIRWHKSCQARWARRSRRLTVISCVIGVVAILGTIVDVAHYFWRSHDVDARVERLRWRCTISLETGLGELAVIQSVYREGDGYSVDCPDRTALPSPTSSQRISYQETYLIVFSVTKAEVDSFLHRNIYYEPRSAADFRRFQVGTIYRASMNRVGDVDW